MTIHQPTDTIRIKRVTDTLFVVETRLANDWQQAQTCETEHDARCYVSGMRDGFLLARTALGNGLHFTGRLEDVV
jgi:hypothetical protein